MNVVIKIYVTIEQPYIIQYIFSYLGPPSISLDNANLQLYPINKNKCHHIDPVRDISFQLYTRLVIIEFYRHVLISFLLGVMCLLYRGYFNYLWTAWVFVIIKFL